MAKNARVQSLAGRVFGGFQVCVTEIRCPCREGEVGVVWPLAGVSLNLNVFCYGIRALSYWKL